jgi:hypothetical protein
MNFRRLLILSACLAASVVGLLGITGYRAVNVYNDARSIESNVRYLIESGESIGTAPASSALSIAFLEIVFGDNPDLLAPLLEIIGKGMEETPGMSLGEVASILVTYRKSDAGEISEVVVHILGEFALGRRQVRMHQDGFFANQYDDNLYDTQQSVIKMLGRDIIVWAKDDAEERPQQELVEAIFTGEIMTLANNIKDKPLYFSAVFPAPRQILPLRMRPHIRAILQNGTISSSGGNAEFIALANDERSADRVMGMIEDLKTSAEVTLRSKFGGTIVQTAWSDDQPEVWWAYEFANIMEEANITRSEQTIRLSADFERRAVNAVMKGIERFGQDFTGVRAVQFEKMLPEEVGEYTDFKRLGIQESTERWGPDWPFPPSGKVNVQRPPTEPANVEAEEVPSDT